MTIRVAIFLAALLAAVAASGQPRTLDWNDLRPPAQEADETNPFDRLTADQTDALREIVRARAVERMGLALPDEGRVKLAQIERRLASEDIDVDAVLAERDAIIKRRTESAEAPVRALDGATVRVAGYALPVASDAGGVRELLLVPWVGACSHAPTPPPNQVVRIVPAQPVVIAGIYDPIVVEGRIVVGATTRSLNFVDGEVSVKSVYAMQGATITPVAWTPGANRP